MKIKLNELHLINFKGIKNLNIRFEDRTSIYGDNATGKTSIFDAFCWLLFGKDSLDRKDFNVKTLLPSGEAVSKLDHSVKAILSVDGVQVTLERVFREKWVKKRGETTSEFSGHETSFFINGVPSQAGEFAKNVSDIIPEQLFKLVTSPYYFNSMKWQDRRSAIIAMAGEVTDMDVAGSNPDFLELIARGKSLDSQKKEAQAMRKMLSEELTQIPSRIDEINRALPLAVSISDLEIGLNEIQGQISDIEAQMTSSRKAYDEANREIQSKQNEFHALHRKLQEIEFSEKQKALAETNSQKAIVVQREGEVSRIAQKIRQTEQDIASLSARIEGLEKRKAELVEKWTKRNGDTPVFSNSFACPTCKRELEASDVEAKKASLSAEFNRQKVAELEAITKEGTEVKRAIDSALNNKADAEKLISSLNEDLRTAKRMVEEAKSAVSEDKVIDVAEILKSSEAYSQTLSKIAELEAVLSHGVTEPDHSDLLNSRASFQKAADEIKSSIAIQKQRESQLKRLLELEARERELSQLIADQEKVIDTVLAFEKARIEMVEENVNGLFSLVRFKMYNRLINGGEEPTCEAMVNGVPFSDANHAAQINAGIDIVNAFSRFYNVSAPVFIDNAEAVTRLLPTDSQTIRLVVSEGDKSLRIESEILSTIEA